MPIYNKNDPNNWYNTLPVQNRVKRRYNPFLDPDFDANKLKENEIDLGDGVILARIPKIEHRIYRRENEDHTTTYIEFIADQYYDPEKKQTRNKKMIIGTDISSRLDGMMIINDNYRDYFDRKGNLISDPMRQRRELEAQEKAKAAEQAKRLTTTITSTGGNETEREKPERTMDEIREALLRKEKLLDEKLREAEEKNREADCLLQQRNDLLSEAEEIRDSKIAALAEREVSRIKLIQEILGSHMDIVGEQAKRRPDTLMRLSQIRTINEILTIIREYASGSDSEDYLHLAEEPAEDDLKNHPGTTYGEMAILLSAYWWTICALRNGYLYEKDPRPEAYEPADGTDTNP